ncbi:MAG: hypothetical protein IT422_29800 [Pirellulaceae bacterium]|jgi:hypothetical protein|nr:hypothetical protein [Pirellulaceae bacterium]
MTSAPSHHKLSALSHATKNARATERLSSNAQTSPVGIPPPVFEALFDDQPVELSRRSRTRRQKRARSLSGSGMTQPFYLSACDSPDHPTSAIQVACGIPSINGECPLDLLEVFKQRGSGLVGRRRKQFQPLVGELSISVAKVFEIG